MQSINDTINNTINSLNNTITLDDVATASLCTLGFVVINKETPSLMKFGLRLGSSILGRMIQENTEISPIELPLQVQIQSQDVLRGVVNTAAGLTQNKSLKNAALNDGLRLSLSSLATRELMKILI
jgi:hypothetical protein